MSSPALKTALAATIIAASAGSALAATYFHPWFDTRRGGSICYYRTYSDAFLKKNPNVKLQTISIERRSKLDDARANSKRLFGLNFGASTKSETYDSAADCKPQGKIISCQLESDGGNVTLHRVGGGLIIKTRRVEIEGMFKDLDISSKKGGATRSFTLKGSRKETCAAMFD